jgi:hypothetical protein
VTTAPATGATRVRHLAYFAVKAVHTAAFLIISGSILTVFADGVLGRNLTWVATSVLGAGMALNLRAIVRGRPPRPRRPGSPPGPSCSRRQPVGIG